MAFRISDAAASAALTALNTAIGTSATIKFYTGSQPATVDTSATGTLLGTLTASSTFGSVSGRTLTAGTITEDSSADATGTAGYVRVFNGSTAVCDALVGAEVTMNSNAIVAGGPIQMSSFVITL